MKVEDIPTHGAQLSRAPEELRPDLPILLATGFAELPAGQAKHVEECENAP